MSHFASATPATSPLFRVQTSEIHGEGLFAARALPANTTLGRYGGQRLSPAEVTEMDWNSQITYLFGLSDGMVIDGSRGGNALRHLNHSCSPNCEAVETRTSDGTLQLEIVTLRDVLADEELCIDYALAIDVSESPDRYPCVCLSATCRGTMVASN
nr:SET domain-containing protein-lysine N-methyltransferase [Variovorax sp. HW608]